MSATAPPGLPLGALAERAVHWLLAHAQGAFDVVAFLVGGLTRAFEAGLTALPATLVVLAFVALATRRLGYRNGAMTAVSLSAVVAMGLWPQLRSTFALVLSAATFSLLIGLPLGIVAARSDLFSRALRPVLDFMQTMPAFVYLIPAVMFFGLGQVPGVVATIIFATPPAVRLTNLGIRQVPRELVEAGLAFGCTRWQLLRKVQIPTALPSIMAGVNQTMMLGLSMVVIASMIGAGGLGNGVLRGIQRLDIGLGFEAGIAVVLLAIVLDRITQSFGHTGHRHGKRAAAGAGHPPAGPRRWLFRVGQAALALAGGVALGYVLWHDIAARAVAPPVGGVAPHQAGATGARTAGGERRCGRLRIGYTAWADAELVTEMAARLLREAHGCDVKLVMTDIGVQYRGLADGELDLMLMAWLPVTHAPYFEQVSSQVLDLGPLYSGARLGWAVPDYVPEAQLGSIEQLRDPAVRELLGGRIQGIDPGSGLMRASERAMSVYGLRGYQLLSGSGAAMTAATARAIRARAPIVVTTWSPHWMFARWRLRYLRDPRGVLSRDEQVHALARAGFAHDFPRPVLDMISRMHIPLAELQAALADAVERSTGEAVDRYLAAHPARVRYWVHGELPSP